MIWKSIITGARYETFDSHTNLEGYMVGLREVNQDRIIRIPYDEFIKIFQRDSE